MADALDYVEMPARLRGGVRPSKATAGRGKGIGTSCPACSPARLGYRVIVWGP